VRPAAGDCTRLAAAGDSSKGGEERWGGILSWGNGDVGGRRGSVLGIKKISPYSDEGSAEGLADGGGGVW
jgi:hypothetical protein